MADNVQTAGALHALLSKTHTETLAWTLSALEPKAGPQQIMFLNAHGVTTAARDIAFRNQLLASDHLLRDGVGVALGLKWLGLSGTENLNGTDLIPQILAQHRDCRIAVWGSSKEALDLLAPRLAREGYANVVSLEHGFHADTFYVDRYHETQPDIVILCMGMPRQEILSAQLVACAETGLIICGGGWANFYSGFVPRAPVWCRKLRLEWLHRLMREPARLGKRYTYDIALFFGLILRISKHVPKP